MEMWTLDGKEYNNAEEFIAKLIVKKAELEEGNRNLKEENEILWEKLEEQKIENKKLKERIKELELCNLNLQKHIGKK